MIDRELLKAAAEAAGIELGEWCEELDAFWKGKTGDTIWNPLTDDGDALRLAVKLKFNVVPEYTWSAPWDNGGTLADPYAATRRAIVRAAAEIGKEMK
jgi:hypothetical protein